MGDDSSAKEEPPPKEPAKSDANVEKASAKLTAVMTKIASTKSRERSKSPEIVFTDSDDPDGDVKRTSKTPEPPKESTDLPSKEERPASSTKPVATDKPSTSTAPFKPLATSTPRPVKAQAPGAPGTKAYGVAGAACVTQSTVKGVRKTQVGQREFYDKYPWLKPTQPSALAPESGTTSDAPASSDAVDPSSSTKTPTGPPSTAPKPKPGGPPQPLRPVGGQWNPPGRPIVPTAPMVAPRAGGPPSAARPTPVNTGYGIRQGGVRTHAAPATPAVPSYRALAQPFNVVRLGAATRTPAAASATATASATKAPGGVSTPFQPGPQTAKKDETPAVTPQMSRHWKKPWSEMTVAERLEQRKLDMMDVQDRKKIEEARRRVAYPRPPPTTMTPMISKAARHQTIGVSKDIIKRFMETASQNETAWKEGGAGGGGPRGSRESGNESASDMMAAALRPFKREPKDDASSSTPKYPAPIRYYNKSDPFAPPAKKTFDPLAQKKRKMRYLEKKAATAAQGKSPEKGKSPQKKGGEGGLEEGERPPGDGNADFNMDDDFVGGGGMSDHGGEGGAGGDGATDANSSFVDVVGSPLKTMSVKKEGGEASIKVKKEQDQDARRAELLKPTMKELYTEEMAALARDKLMFERELMEKMSKDREKLPALPSLSQLQTNLRDKPDDLKEAMDRLVENMKRIGSKDGSSDAPQGELTKHLNEMMDTMKKEVFLGTVRTEVYEAEGNMFEEAAYDYVKKSSMTRLGTDDYSRGLQAIRIARQEREQKRLRAERKRDELRRSRILNVGLLPQGRISKKALSKMTEAQRLRRKLPAPRTPPGSPPRGSPPVSTAGSRVPSPERLPLPVTPPGSPPPLGEKSKKASRKHLEVILDESFDVAVTLDDHEEEERKELKLSEDRKKRDLQAMQRRYEYALHSFNEVEKKKGTVASLSQKFPGSVRSRSPENWIKRQPWEIKMRQLQHIAETNEKASDKIDEMSNDFLTPKRPSILQKRGESGKKGKSSSSEPFTPWEEACAEPDDMLMLADTWQQREEREEAERIAYRGKQAVAEAREQLRLEKLQPVKYTRRRPMRMDEISVLPAALLSGKQLQLRPEQRLSRSRVTPMGPLTETQLEETIDESTELFEELFHTVQRTDLSEREKEHHINRAVNKAGDFLSLLECAMRMEQKTSSIPPFNPGDEDDDDSSIFVGDVEEGEDVVLKSKRTKLHRLDSVAPALSPEPRGTTEREGGAHAAGEAPPTLDAQPKGRTAIPKPLPPPAPLTAAEKQMITVRLASLWKMSEELPNHIKAMARRAMPTSDGARAKAVLDLRARIVSAERLKERYRSRRMSLKAKEAKVVELEEFKSRHTDQIFNRMLEKMIDDVTETEVSRPKSAAGSMQLDDDAPDPIEPEKPAEKRAPLDDSVTVLDRISRLRREEELRRAEATRQAKKRAAEEKRVEEEKKRQRERQRLLLGGVVVGLQAGETYSKSAAKVSSADPSTDSNEAAEKQKKRVLIKKELSLKERESLILAEFYKYWRGKTSAWTSNVDRKTVEKHTIDEINAELDEGTFPPVESKQPAADPRVPGEPIPVQKGAFSDIDEEERSERGAEKEKETGEKGPGTSEESTSADAAKEKERGEGGGEWPMEMKPPHEMELNVRTVYNRWRQTRKQARELRLNTGNMIDEVELEEVEVPEGTGEEDYEDTRPFQPKAIVPEGKKGDVGDRPRAAWMNTVPVADGDFALQLGEKQRILKKRARGEKLTTNERRFMMDWQQKYAGVKVGVETMITGPRGRTEPLIVRNAEPLRLPGGGSEVLSRRVEGEGARKRVIVTRVPGGDGRLRRIVRLSSDARRPPPRRTPRAPSTDDDAADVRAVLSTMLKKICVEAGEEEEEAVADAPEESPPCFDVPSGGEEDDVTVVDATVPPPPPRNVVPTKRAFTPATLRSVLGEAAAAGGDVGKTRTVKWTPGAGFASVGDTASTSTPLFGRPVTPSAPAPQHTPRPVTPTFTVRAPAPPPPFVLPMAKTPARTGSAPATAPKKKDDVRAVMDELLRKVCGDEEESTTQRAPTPGAKKRPGIVWRKVTDKEKADAPEASGEKKKEIFFNPLTAARSAKKAAAPVKFIISKTPLLSARSASMSTGSAPIMRSAPTSRTAPSKKNIGGRSPLKKKRDDVREALEDMIKIVCAQAGDPVAPLARRIVRRAVAPGQKAGEANDDEVVVLSDADDDVGDEGGEAEEEDEERVTDGRKRQKVMKKKRTLKQSLDSLFDSDDEDLLAREKKSKKAPVIIRRLNDPIRIPERRKEENEFVPSSRPRKNDDGSMPSLALEGSGAKEGTVKKVKLTPVVKSGPSVVQLDASDEEKVPKIGKKGEIEQLGWIDCLRLVEQADQGETLRVRKMKRKMVKIQNKWMAVDAAAGRKVVAKSPEKRGGTAMVRKTIHIKGEKAGELIKQRFFTTSAGKRIAIKPRYPAKNLTLKKRGAAAAAAGPSPKVAAAGMPQLQPAGWRYRPADMPKLAKSGAKEPEADDAPDLGAAFDNNDDVVEVPQPTSPLKPSKRVLEKRREERKRKASGGDDEGDLDDPTGAKAKKKYRILEKAAPTPVRTLITGGSPAKKPPAILVAAKRLAEKGTQATPPPGPSRVEWTRQEQQEMLEKDAAKKRQDWEIRKNEATITRQREQIEMQKRLLGEVRKEMVKTFENAERTNKLVEKTRRAMIGECHDFGEYRKLVDAREKLMNTLYETTMEKMKATVAQEETRRRGFENYKKKAIRREKALIKEIEHTKEQLDKAHQKALENGMPKKAPACPVPFTKAPLRSKNNRFNFVLDAIKRVLGDGVEGDMDLEKEQVKAIIEKLHKKYEIQTSMSVEEDREFCAEHEIGYRKRIHMKKFLAKMGLDFFCSQRAFDKVRRELGEADGTEETAEMSVKREKRERKGVKKEGGGGGRGKKMIDPREISLGRSGAEEDEASDVDIEEILVDDDYNIIESRVQTGVTDGGETSGAERERAERRYNMARFAGTRLLTSDEEYIEESDPDQPGPSHRYIPVPVPTRYVSVSSGRPATLLHPPPPSQLQQQAQPSHYLHGAPILQSPQRQREQHLQQLQLNARRGRGGARVRGGHNQ